MSPEAAWALTPAQYQALSSRFHEGREFFDFEMGYTRAILVEPHRDRKRQPKPFEPKDFMLFSSKDKGAKSSDEEMLSYVKNVLTPYFNTKDVQEKQRILQQAK